MLSGGGGGLRPLVALRHFRLSAALSTVPLLQMGSPYIMQALKHFLHRIGTLNLGITPLT